MLQPIVNSLATKRLILASTSPRRKSLLENLDLKFEVVPSKFEENLKKDDFPFPVDYVRETAKQKTLEVANRLYKTENPVPDLIVGADTIVTMDNEIFEKPSSPEHAVEILTRFSGKIHTVYTAVVLVIPNRSASNDTGFELIEFHEGTDVEFGDLTPEIIQAYVATGEPMDKAGGYGIQAKGGNLIKTIRGDYFNVVGFPLYNFSKNLLDLYYNSNKIKK